MAEELSNCNLDTFASADGALKDYTLYQLYNKNFNIPCNDEREEFSCNTGQNYSFDDEKIKEFYNKLVRNLKMISKKDQYFNSLIINENKLCTYLKYWFHDQVISKKYNSTEVDKIFKAWNNSDNSFLKHSPCYIHALSLNKIQEIKPVYDYFILYDRNNNKEIETDKILKTKYCEYFKIAQMMYVSKDTMCQINVSSPVCNEYNQNIKTFVEYDEDFIISCESEEEIVKAIKTIIIVLIFLFFGILSLLLLYTKVKKIYAYAYNHHKKVIFITFSICICIIVT
ncbi:variable surface protein [Plasmodium gonderi]|uniref:Variable surface protein n=1 Tax=Plasmodium gonderi TaxID=77519 RepID=A0A1Y1JS30_PLAGO|nr:variable surface protein [Plasmodium gonderi]GAW83997.1 variable surface protein [Plasmodium gonderi]